MKTSAFTPAIYHEHPTFNTQSTLHARTDQPHFTPDDESGHAERREGRVVRCRGEQQPRRHLAHDEQRGDREDEREQGQRECLGADWIAAP